MSGRTIRRAGVLSAAAGCLGGVLGTAVPAIAEPVMTPGRIDQVTVYRGQALVTRAVPLETSPGLVEVVITDLPEQVVPGSIYAESGPGLEVRSVRYRTRPVMADVNEEVRQLDEQIKALGDQGRAAARATEVLAEHKAYLAKLEGFVAPAATTELSKGVLNAETLEKLTAMLLTQRRAVAAEELKLVVEQRDIAERLALVQRQRQTITAGSARTLREAVVLAEVKEGGRGVGSASLRVRYLVGSATWEPSYTVRAEPGKKGVLVEYYGAVEQMTGEDWTNVTMTLSTATPSLAARGPVLTPLTLSLAPPAPNQQMAQQIAGMGYADAKKEIARQRAELDNLRKNRPAEDSRFDAGDLEGQLNTVAGNDLLLDMLANERVLRGQGRRPAILEEGVSVVYELGGKTSLPSRRDRQQVQIAAASMPAEFYKIASPALTSNVYDEAMATNTARLVLLSGPVMAYVQGRFVGRGELPTIASGESFTLGFGIDTAMKAGRELVERSDSVQGGNRVVDLTYRLTLENFGDQPAPVRLMDRIPKVRDGEIRLTLNTGSTPPSQDPEAQAAQKRSGLIRWDVTAPPQAFGIKALVVEYGLRLEHDKQMTVASRP
jgi:hypothetical protein